MRRSVKSSLLFLSVLVSIHICTAIQAESDRGIRLFQERKFAEAQRCFEQAIREDGTDHFAAFYLGRIFLISDDYDRAVAWLEKAVQMDGQSSEYHRWLGRSYGYKAQRAFIFKQPFLAKKALSMFERAVELDPDNIAARISLTHYYSKAPGFMGGGGEKAEKQVEEIKRRDANTWLLARGIIASEREDYEKAEEHLILFLTNEPATNPALLAEGHFELGAVYEKQGKTESARREYKRSLQLDPNNKEAQKAAKNIER